MLKRTVTGLILVAVLAAFVLLGYFVSPIFIDMLVLLFLAGSVYEMRKSFKDVGYDMYVVPAVFMLICAYPVFYLMQHYMGQGSAGVQGLLIVLLISIMIVLSTFTFRPLMKKRKGAVAMSEEAEGSDEDPQKDGSDSGVTQKKEVGNINNLIANVFIIIYPMLFMSAAWILSYKYSALFAILFAVVVPVIGSDMFAYFVGSMIGGKKLCPSISPKKTVAGAIGGLFGGMIMAILFWVIFEYVGSIAPDFAYACNYFPFIPHWVDGWMWKSALIYLSIGLVCGAVSELGDLAASAIKRAIGIKDYGKIFPGHGGFMDRIDSVMYCIVVLLIAFTCIYGY